MTTITTKPLNPSNRIVQKLLLVAGMMACSMATAIQASSKTADDEFGTQQSINELTEFRKDYRSLGFKF